jgi:hypothetical protein
MSNFYIYLISSLPMLQFGAKPPFSFAQFLEKSQDLIPEEDLNILKGVSRIGEYFYSGVQPTLLKWELFDTMIRNELVRINAAHKKINTEQYLRLDGYIEPEIAHMVSAIYRNPAHLEAEKALDLERWHYLEQLETGHFFDLDILIIYALKLLILERWEKVRSADKEKLLEQALL